MIRRACILGFALGAVVAVSGADHLKFPAAQKRPVTDTYFGVTIRDEYRWLENEQDPAVQTWAGKQNKRTRGWLDDRPEHATIKRQLQAWEEQSSPSYPRLVDSPAGVFALKMAPGKQQSFLVRLATVDDPASAVIVIDPNDLDPTGATAIDWWVPSPSGQRIAVCLSQRGTEAGTLRFFDALSGTALPDQISRVQYPTAGGSAVWTRDESAVFYTCYPAPGERPEADDRFYQQVYRHRIGTEPAQDTYSVGREFPRIAEIQLSATPDGLFTLAQVANGDGGDLAYYLMPEGGRWEPVAALADGVKKAVLGDDGMIYALTHKDAPHGRIVRMPLEHPDIDSAVEVASQTDGVIRDFVVQDGRLYVSEIVGGPSRLRQYSTDGSSTRIVTLPAECSVGAFVARKNGTLLLRLSRYVEPTAWYEFNPTHTTLRKTALANTAPVDFSDIRVERLTAHAPDGVEIPITILAPKNVSPGTPAPLLLQGYGAYGAPNEPDFVIHRRLWFNAGGVIAIAHVRGGGDFGAAWHKAGNLVHKQTTFSDFTACAQRLISLAWTNADRLAIQGASAGGLLMGAALTQHPELFRAVVSRVGIYDALRSERWPNGEFNTTEFGTASVREQFEALRAYSPYHHVTNGTKYPAILLTTGVHDGRVPPGHSFKMAARLQAATASKYPVLLRVDFESGHGIGSSRKARLDENADVYAFLFEQLGMTMQKR